GTSHRPGLQAVRLSCALGTRRVWPIDCGPAEAFVSPAAQDKNGGSGRWTYPAGNDSCQQPAERSAGSVLLNRALRQIGRVPEHTTSVANRKERTLTPAVKGGPPRLTTGKKGQGAGVRTQA